jgi:hypothetical protein
MSKSVAIIIPAFRRPDELDKLLYGIKHKLVKPEDTIVTCFVFINDWHNYGRLNKSNYENYNEQEYLNFDHLVPGLFTFIRSDFNWRYSRTINMGLVLAWDYNYALLLNDDCGISDSNLLVDLCNFIDKSAGVASVSPVCRQADGFIYSSGALGNGGHYNDKPKAPRVVPSNNFAACLLNMIAVRDIGLLRSDKINHTHYHHYGSDADWCKRASDKNWAHWNIPTECMHYYMVKNEPPAW